MTTKLELPDDLSEDAQLRGEASSRPATVIRASPSMLEQRKRIADKFLTGEWGVELSGFEEGRIADRESAVLRRND